MTVPVKSVFSTLLFLTVTLVPALRAQDVAAYVSRLTATPGVSSVMLTWKDAQGFPGAQYEIWRSDKEIVKETFSQANLLGTVATGVEAYEDTTATVPSYYLVLLKDASGSRRSFFIPFRNKTTVAAKADPSIQLPSAKITVGTVVYSDPQLLIPFQATPSDRKLGVYRRLSPITSAADLKDATLLGTVPGSQSPFRDTPAPGLDFYYAIVDSHALAIGRPDAFQKEAATSVPAGFPLVSLPANVRDSALDENLRPTMGASLRALPLPLLELGSEPDSGAPLVEPAYEPIRPAALDSSTEKALKLWSKRNSTGGKELPPPVVLPEERSGSQTGAGKYLVQIQTAYLGPRDWTGALKSLETLVKLDMDPRTLARTRFYLGEAKAYEGRYREAFMEFLESKDAYPGETGPFIEALFSLLSTEKD